MQSPGTMVFQFLEAIFTCVTAVHQRGGFLDALRGIRYHVNEWGVGTSAPGNKEEYFNMKHCKARNVIEHTFGILKMRWATLRSASYYPIKFQNRIIMACCLLQNFIRKTMGVDPMEGEVPDLVGHEGGEDDSYVEVVRAVLSGLNGVIIWPQTCTMNDWGRSLVKCWVDVASKLPRSL